MHQFQHHSLHAWARTISIACAHTRAEARACTAQTYLHTCKQCSNTPTITQPCMGRTCTHIHRPRHMFVCVCVCTHMCTPCACNRLLRHACTTRSARWARRWSRAWPRHAPTARCGRPPSSQRLPSWRRGWAPCRSVARVLV